MRNDFMLSSELILLFFPPVKQVRAVQSKEQAYFVVSRKEAFNCVRRQPQSVLRSVRLLTMGRITIFSLKTCPHCRKAKARFDELGWEYAEVSLTGMTTC